jgi:CPA2 family monovalent cation:H+ antiporter-2
MFRTIRPAEHFLQKFPRLWKMLDRQGPPLPQSVDSLQDHVVIVDYGRVGHHIVDLLGELGISHLVVEFDPERRSELNRRGIPTLYGDAANSEVMTHAGLAHARALVVTGPDEDANALIVTAARDLAPRLPIIARASSEEGTKHLAQLGAQDVIHPELEGGLEIVRHTLLQLGFPLQEIFRYTDAVRHDHYDLHINTEVEHRLLHDLVDAANSIEIHWFRIPGQNPLIGQTLAEANLRARTGASVVALHRQGDLIANPKSMTVFQAGDRVGLIGDEAEIEQAEELLRSSKDSNLEQIVEE